MATKPTTAPGAQVEEVEVKSKGPEQGEVDIVVTQPGTFGKGLCQKGDKHRVPLSMYSATWMSPASSKDAEKIRKHFEQ
ncbi:MAG: hypothetical protein AAFY25_04815 [Pseudomonadota bacterium]